MLGQTGQGADLYYEAEYPSQELAEEESSNLVLLRSACGNR
jgi:hypothetical protein